MTSTTTQSPITDITQAEAEAKSRIDKAREDINKEEAVFQKAESERLENGKNDLKESATQEVKKEKNALGSILKDGEADTGKQVDTLKKTCEKNEKGVIDFLVDEFLSLKI